MRQIAGPDRRGSLPKSQIDRNLDLRLGERSMGVGLFIWQRSAVGDELKVVKPERDTLGGKLDAATPDRRQHAAPVGILAIEGSLDQRRRGDHARTLAGLLE